MAIYVSKSRQYRIIIQPKRTKQDVDTGIVTKISGVDVQFENGVYETTDEKIIKALEECKYYGIDYTKAEKRPARKKKANVSSGPVGIMALKNQKNTKEDKPVDNPTDTK